MRYGFKYKGKLYGCPRSYYLRYISGILPAVIDAKPGIFGSVIHNVLNEFYKSVVPGYISNYPTVKAYFYSVLETLLQRYWDYTLTDQMYKDALAILSNFAENEANRWEKHKAGIIAEFNPIFTELPIEEPFNIRIDKVLHPDHTMMDYKTTKYLPANLNPQNIDEIDIEYILQGGLYAYAYYNKYNRWTPKMVYYFLRFSKAMPVMITREVVDLSLYIASSVADGINNRRFPKNSENCKYCDYRHVCGLEELGSFLD